MLIEKSRALAAITLAVTVLISGGDNFASVASSPNFGRDVLPILSENCFACHGPDASDRKADLRLDTREGAEPVLEGKLLGHISARDPDEIMPPPDTGKKLTANQIKTLRHWIADGAPYEKHWSFEPLKKVTPPSIETTNRPVTDIDRFLLARLQEAGLEFSPPATREQLIRRATFDLTGLPPSWEEVTAFTSDDSKDAWEKVIDRLLASDAYGERWGRHWLDLARYADTHGGSAIGFKRFPFSYTYRDYVIAAFNDDRPYDQFILEQLAADQLGLEENDPALAALGFLTVGRQYRNRHDQLDDQIDVITRGLLGLTVSCARCHDHKFDPIPTTDYYALHTTLANSRMPANLPLVGEPEIPEKYEVEFEKRQRLRDDIVREHGDVFRGRLRMQTALYLRELASGSPELDTSTTFLSYRTEDSRPVILERWRKYLARFDESDPVFGPWHRLSKLEDTSFAQECRDLVTALKKENGDPKKFADEHKLGTAAPKWNPRILEALEKSEPKNFTEVADAYGAVFTRVHEDWMQAQLEAALEAAPGGTIIPDQDVKHRVINSAIERQLRHHLFDLDSPTAITFDNPKHLMILNRGVRDSVRGTLGAIENLNLTSSSPPRSMSLFESPDPVNTGRVFLRGNPVARGEFVQARFIGVLSGGKPEPFPDGERRLGLARAIIKKDNPLTRRVIVNWVWQHHFGRGLVRTPDDFGTRGDPPTHPDLLDFLAEKILEDGWSLKKLHRRILLSTAWQQSSREPPGARHSDPENQLLWRMPPRRLDLEAMRDSLLAVSGELDRTFGGKPFEETDDKVTPRRSIYAFLNRDVIPKMVSTFDGADPSACTVKRPDTTVPQQTLFALNSGFIQGRADALVKRPEIQKIEDSEEKIQAIYRIAYGRSPNADEVKSSLDYLSHSKQSDLATWSRFAHVLLASNEFHFLD